jgi:hypothetical protein
LDSFLDLLYHDGGPSDPFIRDSSKSGHTSYDPNSPSPMSVRGRIAAILRAQMENDLRVRVL